MDPSESYTILCFSSVFSVRWRNAVWFLCKQGLAFFGRVVMTDRGGGSRSFGAWGFWTWTVHFGVNSLCPVWGLRLFCSWERRKSSSWRQHFMSPDFVHWEKMLWGKISCLLVSLCEWRRTQHCAELWLNLGVICTTGSVARDCIYLMLEL